MSDNIGIEFNFLKGMINDKTQEVKTKLQEIKAGGDGVAIGDMFEMQMKMNTLAQFSEMSTSVMSSSNTSLSSMARNVKS
jgi:hypothetical protein